jgi:hypothetical protein
MNKRIKKKLSKRYGYKKYSKSRRFMSMMDRYLKRYSLNKLCITHTKTEYKGAIFVPEKPDMSIYAMSNGKYLN